MLCERFNCLELLQNGKKILHQENAYLPAVVSATPKAQREERDLDQEDRHCCRGFGLTLVPLLDDEEPQHKREISGDDGEVAQPLRRQRAESETIPQSWNTKLADNRVGNE